MKTTRLFALVLSGLFLISNLGFARVSTLSLGDILKIERASDGTYKAFCKDGSIESATEAQIMAGTICQLTGIRKCDVIPTGSTDPLLAKFSCSIDQFNSAPKIDLVWVIDNSASMSEHQIQLINAAQNFFKNFVSTFKTGWKMGVISTTFSDIPYLGFTNVDAVDSQSKDNYQRFSQAIGNVGVMGSGTETPLESLLKIKNNAPSFFRSDAILVVVVVSDADDDSKITVDLALSKLISGSNGVKTYGLLAGIAPGCKNEYGKDNEIPNLADPLSIKVYYDGAELPPGPLVLGGFWIFDTKTNLLKMHSMAFAIDPSKKIEIEYLRK